MLIVSISFMEYSKQSELLEINNELKEMDVKAINRLDVKAIKDLERILAKLKNASLLEAHKTHKVRIGIKPKFQGVLKKLKQVVNLTKKKKLIKVND